MKATEKNYLDFITCARQVKRRELGPSRSALHGLHNNFKVIFFLFPLTIIIIIIIIIIIKIRN